MRKETMMQKRMAQLGRPRGVQRMRNASGCYANQSGMAVRGRRPIDEIEEVSSLIILPLVG